MKENYKELSRSELLNEIEHYKIILKISENQVAAGMVIFTTQTERLKSELTLLTDHLLEFKTKTKASKVKSKASFESKQPGNA